MHERSLTTPHITLYQQTFVYSHVYSQVCPGGEYLATHGTLARVGTKGVFVADVNLHVVFSSEVFLAVVTLIWPPIVVFRALVFSQLSPATTRNIKGTNLYTPCQLVLTRKKATQEK